MAKKKSTRKGKATANKRAKVTATAGINVPASFRKGLANMQTTIKKLQDSIG